MSAPVRVVHVVWGAGFGGIERFVSDLARVQAAVQGDEAGVFVAGAAPGDTLLAQYAAPGVTVTGGGFRSGSDARPGRLRAAARLLSGYDVVHVHGFVPGLAPAIYLARRPMVFTEHGLLGLGSRWPSQAAVKQSAKGLFLRTKACATVGVSQWVAEAAEKKYRLAPERVFHIPDGADLAAIRADKSRDNVLRQEQIDPATWVMTVTARFVRFKRIDRLLDAAARLGGEGRPWALLLAGGGPLEATLRNQAVSLGISERVHFLGFRTDPWDLVAAADIAPVPSDFEAFGLVVLEAMALGRPVVAFADSGGPAEIFRAVGGGCAVATVEEYAAVLERCREGGEVGCLRPLDRDLFERTYGIQTTAAGYEELYRAAVAGDARNTRQRSSEKR